MTPQSVLFQTIVDVVVPQTVFGRTCLAGRTPLLLFRPHTAGATAKAAARSHAPSRLSTRICRRLEFGTLSGFNQPKLRYGNELHQYGVALGSRWVAEAKRDKSGGRPGLKELA